MTGLLEKGETPEEKRPGCRVSITSLSFSEVLAEVHANVAGWQVACSLGPPLELAVLKSAYEGFSNKATCC